MADDERFALGRRGAEQIARALRKIHALPPYPARATRRQQAFSQFSTGLIIQNGSSETIPAFGVMRISSFSTLGDELVYIVDKPDTTFRRFYLVNGPEDLAVQDYGTGYLADLPVRALYDTADSLVPGTGRWLVWGPYPDSWKLRRHYYGFYVFGDQNTTVTGSENIKVVQNFVEHVAAKADTHIDKNDNTKTVSVWKGDRSADTGMDIVNVMNPYIDITSGAKLRIGFNAETPEIMAAECDP